MTIFLLPFFLPCFSLGCLACHPLGQWVWFSFSSPLETNGVFSSLFIILILRRRGTWHGPSLEDIEKAIAKPTKEDAQVVKKVSQQQQAKQPKQPKQPKHQKTKEVPVEVKPVVVPKVAIIAPATVPVPTSAPAPVAAVPVVAPVVPAAPSKKASSAAASESKVSKAQSPTLFQMLTKANIDWCRYCGTTEGVNWRPGPWGKRTLCNKHGCDFKGYGFACKLPRLDLTSYAHETVDQRIRPVLQHCKCPNNHEKNSFQSELNMDTWTLFMLCHPL